MKKSLLHAVKDRDLCFFLSAPALLWESIFFYVPIILMVVSSFIVVTTGGAVFSLEHYRVLLDPIYLVFFFRSLFLAFFTAVLSLLCAYPAVYYIVFRAPHWLKNVLLFLLVLPFWVNIVVHIYAWFFVLEKYGIINSFLLSWGIITTPLPLINNSFAVYLVMLYCYLPFMVLPLYASLEKLDARLIDASLDLGASVLRTFFRVTVPLSRSGIRTGFLLVFVPSFGEFVIPTLMGGGEGLLRRLSHTALFSVLAATTSGGGVHYG